MHQASPWRRCRPDTTDTTYRTYTTYLNLLPKRPNRSEEEMNSWILAINAVVGAIAAQGTELTVYNQGFALVKEQRSLNLRQGVQQVAVEDVAQMIEANSVAIKSLT